MSDGYPRSATDGRPTLDARPAPVLPESAISSKRLKSSLSDQAFHPPRRVAIASDHRGFAAKHRLLDRLRSDGVVEGIEEIEDFGCDEGTRGCDYPDYALPVARLIAEGEFDVAILLDGSGIGMGIAANKVAGARAATCHDEITARIAREHNHCNILCVGTDLVGERTLFRVAETFLMTPFTGGRHVRRVAKLIEHEKAVFVPAPGAVAARLLSS